MSNETNYRLNDEQKNIVKDMERKGLFKNIKDKIDFVKNTFFKRGNSNGIN